MYSSIQIVLHLVAETTCSFPACMGALILMTVCFVMKFMTRKVMITWSCAELQKFRSSIDLKTFRSFFFYSPCEFNSIAAINPDEKLSILVA